MPTVLEQPDITYKVILLGNSGVGKTNLLARYADNTFDMNSKHTIGVELERVELEVGEWHHMATSNGCDPEACTFLLIGNKVDLAYKRAVNTTDGIGLATNYQMNFFETSAKDATNVEKAFQELIYQINDLHLKAGGASKNPDTSEKMKLEGKPINLVEDANEGSNNPLTSNKKGTCCK